MEETDTDQMAERLLEKVRMFAASLDDEERALFAALVAPGVASAWSDKVEVEGFGVGWSAARLPDHLQRAIRAQDLRVEGWSPPE